MLACIAYTDIGGRDLNEDSVSVYTDGISNLCAVLADGLGGHGGGEIASRVVTNTIIDGWGAGCTEEMLAGLIGYANERVVSMQTNVCSMKSTVVALSIQGYNVVWAHVGDSRLYCFKDGAMVWRTVDHSASQLSVIMGEITPDQIRFDEGRSMLFRVVGQQEGAQPDTGSLLAEAGSYAFLLCSDGFWEYVLEEEMVGTLALSGTPSEWMDRMRTIHAGKKDVACDNNSAIAVWLGV